MNKIIFIALLTLISNSLNGQNQNDSSDSTNQNGKVYFMRSTGFEGSATGYTVFIDDSFVCKLNNKRFSIHDVTPGIHNFSAQFGSKNTKEKFEKTELTIEAGKTYYIQLIYRKEFWKVVLFCQEMTENSAKRLLIDLVLDKKCQ